MRIKFFLMNFLWAFGCLTAITFDDIEFWVGEGENQAGIVIDWQDNKLPKSIVWGFRWNGEATGDDLLNAIIEADPQLFGDHALPETLQFDFDSNGTIEQNDHNQTADMNNGSFWAYYTSFDAETWNFATTTHHGRTLVDGEWDGWSYIEDWTIDPYPTISEPVPAGNVTPFVDHFPHEDVLCWIGEGSNESIFVVDFNSGDEIESYVWGVRWEGESISADSILALISENDERITIEINSFLNSITLDINLDGNIDLQGIGGNPSYWSTWSYTESSDWQMNDGIATLLHNNDGFACSYGWNPDAIEPEYPTPIQLLEDNSATINFSEIQYWIGEGSNESALIVDFNTGAEVETFVWGYRWNSEFLTGEELMQAIADEDPRLTINIEGWLNDITLDMDQDGTNDYEGFGGNPEYWSTWSHLGENSSWILNNGVSETMQSNHTFGCSYGFTPEATAPNNLTFISEPLVPEAPIAATDLINIRNDMQQMIDVLANDSDNDAFGTATINITNGPNHGTMTIDIDNKIQFLPENNFEGQDTFTYTITDETSMTSNEAEVIVNVFNPFSPSADNENAIAIHKDSDAILGWAETSEVTRGYINIQDPLQGNASFGYPQNAIGEAEGLSTEVVSLGDGGSAILTFEFSIKNGEGYDFAVYENAFNHTALEFAFVEVSSDGENYVRFPSVSLTQPYSQIGEYDTTETTNIHNLAGKFIQGYGTPFDLAELADSTNIDINNVSHIKIIDVVGSIHPDFAQHDAYGGIINEPFPGSSASNGFDLDGVAVLHWNEVSEEINPETLTALEKSYPNPFIIGQARIGLTIGFSLTKKAKTRIDIYNTKGQFVKTLTNQVYNAGKHQVQWNGKTYKNQRCSSGVYFYRMRSENYSQTNKVLIIN